MKSIATVLFISLFIFSSPKSSYAQIKPQTFKEELKKLLQANTSKNDSLIIKTYKQLGEYYYSHIPDSAIYFYLCLDTFSVKKGYNKEHGEAQNGIGTAYYVMGDYELSLKYFLEAKKIYEKIHFTKGIATQYNNIALIKSIQKLNKEAIKMHLKSVSLAKKIKDNKLLSKNYFNISINMQDMKEYDSALAYINKSIEINHNFNDITQMAMNLNRKGDILYSLDRKKEAQHIHKYIIDSLKTDNNWELSFAYLALARIYSDDAEYTKSIKYGNKAIEYANLVGSVWDLKLIYQIMAKNYEKTKNYKNAFISYKKYKALSDSIFRIDKEAELNKLFLKAQKLENQELIKETELTKQKLKNRTLYLFILMAVIIFSSGLLLQFIRTNRLKKHLNQKLLIKNRQLEQTNKKANELSSFKQIMFSTIVHDMKNSLNAINLFAKDAYVKEAGRTLLHLVNNILDVGKFEKTGIKANLKTHSLNEFINKALHEVSFLIEMRNIQVELNVLDNIQVICDIELTVRVMVNLLTNAIKYSHEESQIIIDTSIKESNVLVTVTDYGVGIDHQAQKFIFDAYYQNNERKLQYQGSTGLGLNFCKAAIEAQGGKIDFESIPNEKTKFFFTLPLTTKKQNKIIPH